ncbi:hypothetical protein NPIL_109091 [Nephila pilipes]|uniref:Uncharacterized protein n=1 Tax=Nephila pilipes TaxID=299642 RepID=A0A8X6MQ79_NEPPI|nr:hypothetical protein NPIL_109091 [Nephila pilipes]
MYSREKETALGGVAMDKDEEGKGETGRYYAKGRQRNFTYTRVKYFRNHSFYLMSLQTGEDKLLRFERWEANVQEILRRENAALLANKIKAGKK